MRAVEAGEAAAVVHDRPILRYYLAKHPESKLVLTGVSYDPQGYGFAVAHGHDIVSRLNVAVLSAQEDGQIKRISDMWLGGAAR